MCFPKKKFCNERNVHVTNVFYTFQNKFIANLLENIGTLNKILDLYL